MSVDNNTANIILEDSIHQEDGYYIEHSSGIKNISEENMLYELRSIRNSLAVYSSLCIKDDITLNNYTESISHLNTLSYKIKSKIQNLIDRGYIPSDIFVNINQRCFYNTIRENEEDENEDDSGDMTGGGYDSGGYDSGGYVFNGLAEDISSLISCLDYVIIQVQQKKISKSNRYINLGLLQNIVQLLKINKAYEKNKAPRYVYSVDALQFEHDNAQDRFDTNNYNRKGKKSNTIAPRINTQKVTEKDIALAVYS